MRRIGRVLCPLGTIVIVLGLSKYHAKYIGEYDWSASSRMPWTLAFIAVLLLSAYAFGVPDQLRYWRRAVVASILAAITGAAFISLAQLVVGSTLLPRFVIFGTAIVLVPWYLLCFVLTRAGQHHDEGRDRVWAVVTSDEAERLHAELGREPERPATIVGHTSIEDRSANLAELVRGVGASVLVLDAAAQAVPEFVSQAATLHSEGTRVRSLSLFYEQWLGKLPANELERVSLMFDIGELHRVLYARQKRLADVVVALVALPLVLLAVPFVVIGNLVANRGSLLFRQSRVGRGGETFTIVKFRTMRAGDDATWTGTRDARVTGFGRLLRRIHIDELPQAWNVLKGELSLIGPRPEQDRYVEELRTRIPFYDVRHLVRPGVTGWAQVKYAYGASEQDALEKLQYEFFYLRHQGVALDLRIAARTLRHILRGGGQ